jgi:hypothetical protein
VYAVVDLRMEMPLWIDTSDVINQMVPIAGQSFGIGYLLLNRATAEMVAEPNGKIRTRASLAIRYNGNDVFKLAIPYKGGAVVIDDASASFIHPNPEPPVVRLFDTMSSRLKVRQGEKTCVIKASRQIGASVHQHPGRVTSGFRCGDLFVTCDDAGFINRLKIEPPR